MKRFAALALALAIFTAPTVALAAADISNLSKVFSGYEETIVHGE
jgi:hypothetical protein